MDDYFIYISDLNNGSGEYNFHVSDSFFEDFNYSVVERAKIDVNVTLKKVNEEITLSLSLSGKVFDLVCDLCTDLLDIPINVKEKIYIYESTDSDYSTDEIIYIKPKQNKLDLKQIIFELISEGRTHS